MKIERGEYECWKSSDRLTLDELNIVYSHIGVHLYVLVVLIVQTTDDNDYDIGKWMQSGKLIGDKQTIDIYFLSIYLDDERPIFFFSSHIWPSV
jgi:hypothetical protein